MSQEEILAGLLSIEALKRIQALKNGLVGYEVLVLPGETED